MPFNNVFIYAPLLYMNNYSCIRKFGGLLPIDRLGISVYIIKS